MTARAELLRAGWAALARVLRRRQSGLVALVLRRIGAAFALMVVTLAGVILGLVIAGRVHEDVGPFQAEFSVVPSAAGGTEVRLPPLGALRVRTHDGPAHLVINLSALDSARTVDLLTQPDGVERASATALEDLRTGVTRLALQVAGVGVLGAMLLSAVVFRSARKVAVSGGLAVVVVAGSLGIAAGTFRRQAIAEPSYEGLLTNAHRVVGDAQKIADRYEEYRAQLQRLVTNVGRLYSAMTTLPAYTPPDGTIRVLHVSDLHLNPTAWSVIRTVVTEFDVKLVIDSGDIVDWGSPPESAYVQEIKSLGVPYVYVRGNHDSMRTQQAVAQQGALVLDNGVVEVAGLRIAGIGDPRFTPDKSNDEELSDAQLQAALDHVGRQLAETIMANHPVDIAVVHDPAMTEPLAGKVPLVLAGHKHYREVRYLDVVGQTPVPQTLLMVEGSTGGAGLRGLEGEEPTPLQMSVLYLGPDHTLQAYDEITVGGTGEAGVTLERHIIAEPQPPPPPVSPSPNPPAATGPPTAGRSS